MKPGAFKLWVNGIQLVLSLTDLDAEARHLLQSLGVAVQVAFDSKGLKPGNHFTGSRVETRRFRSMGRLINFIKVLF
jgi:hypothetical protein